MLIDIVRALALALGLFFMIVAAIGIVRLESFYERIHAPTKAVTLGLIFLLLAVVLSIPERGVAAKAFLAVIFFAVTGPVGAHILCRTAYRNGVRPRTPLGRDDYESELR